ncbi:MAG: hypothetical protein K2M30_05150 [Desulfovibrionaceae bacterium]|nr:hypothetical protein [Desulfovibrionaceae bacterium]
MSKTKEKKHYFGHRARLLKRVLQNISHVEDYELLEALLTFVQPRKDVKKQAKDILERAGSIQNMKQQSSCSYENIEGVGQHISWYCALLVEIAKRYACLSSDTHVYHDGSHDAVTSETTSPLYTITSFMELKNYLEKSNIYTYTHADYIIYVNSQREVLSMEEYSFREENIEFVSHILSHRPAGIILVRKIDEEQYILNRHDVDLLKKWEKALYLFGIVLLDYVICTPLTMVSLQQYTLLHFKDI